MIPGAQQPFDFSGSTYEPERDQQRLATVVYLRKLGLTSDQIGERIGRTGARVRQILRDCGMGTGERTLEQRLLAKVEKTETCWLWTGSRDHHGYGWLNVGKDRRPGFRKIDRAHRVSYRLYVNPDCAPRVHILHSCDNPLCVNPSHLREGTPADNTVDRETRGRGRHKLNADSVREIRELFRTGKSNKEIAASYKLHRSAIERIRNGKAWSFVK